MKKSLIKLTVIALSIAMNWLGLLAVGQTVASLSDSEISSANIFGAGELNLIATPLSFTLGVDAGETEWIDIIFSTSSDSIPFTHAGRFAWIASSTGSFCSGIRLLSGISTTVGFIDTYDGVLWQFISSATSTMGTLRFNFTATTTFPSSDYGDTCEFDLLFDAAQNPYIIASTSQLGFSDHELVHGTLTARRQVVLNEFLPNPVGTDNARQPDGEWVEIYNNGSSAVSLDGWFIRNKNNGNLNKISITSFNTDLATTTIAGHGFLLVYMNKTFFNNRNDSVRLFDATGNLVDSFSYCGSNTAQNGNGNNCANKAEGNSWARIPDGTGGWVDPVPTPGISNVVANNIDSAISNIQDTANATNSPEIIETEALATGDGTEDMLVMTSFETPLQNMLAASPDIWSAASYDTTYNKTTSLFLLSSAITDLITGSPEEWNANAIADSDQSETSKETPAEKHLSSPIAQEREEEDIEVEKEDHA